MSESIGKAEALASDASGEVAKKSIGALEGLLGLLGQSSISFASTAIVGAFLLFAGFLSEFAVYQFAGIPRMSFNLTSLTESGAEVVIDTLSAITSDRPHSIALFMMVFLVIVVWSYSNNPRLQRLSSSASCYELCLVAAMLFGFSLLVGQIQFASDSLQRSDGQKSYEQALSEIYQDTVPNPRIKLRELEKVSYDLQFFPLANFLEKWLDGDSRSEKTDWVENFTGIPLRILPESRNAARHVFGWLVLCLMWLTFVDVLLVGWGRLLRQQSQLVEGETLTAVNDSNLGGWRQVLSFDLTGPSDRFILPLTVTFTLLCFAVLPLSHGLLARPSIGHETVLVKLETNPTETKEKAETEEHHEQDGAGKNKVETNINKTSSIFKGALPPTRDCLDQEKIAALEDAEQSYRKQLKALIQTHTTESDMYHQARVALSQSTQQLTNAVKEHNCPEALQRLSALRPSEGLAFAYPEIAADFRSQTGLAFESYGYRLGTIVSYPRDNEPLALLETIQPRTMYTRGEWSLTSHQRDDIVETVVLPDTVAHEVAQDLNLVITDPRNKAIVKLLGSQTPEAFIATLDLLENHLLSGSNDSGVAVTSIGGMARSNVAARPDLASRAIDDLIRIASRDQAKIWPNKSNNIRGAALSALHLAYQPYAAAQLAALVRKEQPLSCQGDQPTPTRCIPQFPTTAGFLLQVLATESRQFTGAEPLSLVTARKILFEAIIQLAMDQKNSESIRGAACSAISFSAVRQFGDSKEELELEHRYANFIATSNGKGVFVIPCIKSMSRLHMERSDHRQVLKQLVKQRGDGQIGEMQQQEAFQTLYELGLLGEEQFLFQLYVDRVAGDAMSDGVERFLEDGDGLIMAKQFTDCIGSDWRQNQERTGRCLQGLKYLESDYDGDEGASETLIALVNQAEIASNLKVQACEVLQHLKGRGGATAKLFLQGGQVQCQSNDGEDELEKLERLLEQMRTSGGSKDS